MTFSFVHITDHHLGESEHDHPYGYPASATFRAVMDHIAAATSAEIDFIVSTGDLVNRPTAASYHHLKSILNLSEAKQIPGPHIIRYGRLWNFPLYVLPGNHDERMSFFEHVFRVKSGFQYENSASLNASFRSEEHTSEL